MKFQQGTHTKNYLKEEKMSGAHINWLNMLKKNGLKNGKNKNLILGNLTAYIILIIAVVLGTAANGFAKGAQGFTVLIPSVLTAITIVGCMYTLSLVMKTIPVGITYASFAGLCIIATTLVGMYKFNQLPDLYTIIGLALIIAGVLIVNLLGKTN